MLANSTSPSQTKHSCRSTRSELTRGSLDGRVAGALAVRPFLPPRARREVGWREWGTGRWWPSGALARRCFGSPRLRIQSRRGIWWGHAEHCLCANSGAVVAVFGALLGTQESPMAPRQTLTAALFLSVAAVASGTAQRPRSATRTPEALQRACDGGDMRACVDLGVRYDDGRGVAQSDTLAAELWRRACDGGSFLGCEKLGRAYSTGRGVPRSDTLAVELFQRACDGGNMAGCGNLGASYAGGRVVPQSDTRAVELFRRACDGGDMLGCSSLGHMYQDGRGVAQSDTRAAELYRRACDRGEVMGCFFLDVRGWPRRATRRRSVSPGVRP